MGIIKFKGCKFLIFDREKIDRRIKIKKLSDICAYWERDKSLLPDESCAVNVQFCEKRGRLNKKSACVMGLNECGLYDEIEHVVDIND